MAIEIPIDNRSIVQLRQELLALRVQIKETTNPDIIKQFESEVTKVNEAIVQQASNYDASGKSVSVLSKEFKAFQDLASETTEIGSQGFQSLARASGQARNGIIAVNEQINQFAAGTVFEQAQLQLGGIKQGLLSLDFDKVSESAANLSNTIKTTGSLKGVFGDIGGAVKNLGSVFAQVGKLLLTNPIFLLATVIAVIVIALVAFLDKVGLLKKAIELLTLPLKLVMGLLTSVTDALGLTAEAQKELAATTIKEGEKVRAEIDRQEKQQLAFYNVTKRLTDQEIADLERKTGVVVDTTKSEFDIRQDALNKRIAQNEKEIAILREIEKSTAGLSEEEQKQLDERVKNQENFADQSIQIELDRTARIADLNRSLNDQLDRVRAQNISNELQRNKELNRLDKEAALDRIDNQIKELQRLGQSTEQAEALRAETITFYGNKETQIRKDASKKAFSEAQQAANARLKAIETEEELKIESLEEGTSQRIIAEEAAGKRILEFQRNNAKLLGLSSNELSLLEIQNRDNVQKKWDEYNTLVADIENRITLNSRRLAIETAKNTEDRIAAEIAYEKEKTRIEGELLKQSIQDRIKAAEGDKELQEKIRQEGIAELQLFWQQRNNVIQAATNKEVQLQLDQDAALAQIASDAAIFDAMRFQGKFSERIRIIEEAFKKEKEALQEQKEAEFAAAEGDEIRLAELREKYRQAELILDETQEEYLRQQRLARIDSFLGTLQDGLNAVADLSNFVLDLESQNLKQGSKEAEAAARKKFEINKAFQIGAAIIDGFKAANASLAVSPLTILGVPNPGGIAALAITIATSLANVAKISAQQYKSSGGAGGGAPAGGNAAASLGGAGSVVPSVNLFGQGNTGNSTQASAPTQTQSPEITVKAVVVETDITQTQRNVSRIESASEL
jgi:hypothetical protein